MTWLHVGNVRADWCLHFDTLSVTMVTIVNTISFLVHIYSIGYMNHDQTPERFMAYLSLFTFMMLMLVTADNMLQIFFWLGRRRIGVIFADWLLV